MHQVFDKVSRSAESRRIIDSTRFEATSSRDSWRIISADEYYGESIVKLLKTSPVFYALTAKGNVSDK